MSVSLGKGMPDLANGFIAAVLAALIGGSRQAWQRRNRPVDDAQELSDGDLFGRFQQLIAAIAAASAGDQPRRLEAEQDLFEEFAGNLLAFGELANLQTLVRFCSGQSGQGFEGVTRAI